MLFKLKLMIFLFSVSVTGMLLMTDFTALIQLQDRSSCFCRKCLHEDDLSLYHQNLSFQPLLSAKTELSEEAFKWWKNLQNEHRNLTDFKETVNQLFKIFPPDPDVKKSSSNRCRTCSVVGNSRNLLGSHYGPLIDFQDVVIRINAGKVKGFEEDVGAKTTHRVMYPESAVDLEDTTHLVLFPFKILDLEWLTEAFTTQTHFKWSNPQAKRSHAPKKDKIKANKNLVMVLNPAFMKYVHEVWLQRKGRYPSTGFMTLILALYICDEVHVFGYGADSDGNWSHYFENLMNKNSTFIEHHIEHEYSVIQQLADNKTVLFYEGR